MRIPCPFCGPRDDGEFEYGGAADPQPPSSRSSESTTEWIEYVYLRRNPAGPHGEHWFHRDGCGQWLHIERDTLSHDILGCRLAYASDGDSAVTP